MNVTTCFSVAGPAMLGELSTNGCVAGKAALIVERNIPPTQAAPPSHCDMCCLGSWA